MKHRDIEYTVVQGIGRNIWKCGLEVDGMTLRGQAGTKTAAIADAERAIDRALAPKKLRLVRPDRER